MKVERLARDKLSSPIFVSKARAYLSGAPTLSATLAIVYRSDSAL